jgi:ADP-ribose pyrophosphatase YjhB (NUDIX family)
MNEKQTERSLSEAEFLKSYSQDEYPRPSLTADIAVFKDGNEGKKEILLIKRKNHPFKGSYALPGGFANPDETIKETARRELYEETKVENISIKPIDMFTKPGRDPRGWVVTYAFLADIGKTPIQALAGDDAAEAIWFEISRKNDIIALEYNDIKIKFEIRNGSTVYKTDTTLAFDHGEILSAACDLLKI